MRKQIRRKSLTLANRRSQLDTHFWKDLVKLIKEKGRTLETKVVLGKYYLLVIEEMMEIAVVVIRNQTEESHGILKITRKSIC